MQGAREAQRDAQGRIGGLDDAAKGVVQGFLCHVAAMVGNRAQGGDLVVVESEDLAVVVVGELEDRAVPFAGGPEQAVVRGVLIALVVAAAVPEDAHPLLVVGVAVVSGGLEAVVLMHYSCRFTVAFAKFGVIARADFTVYLAGKWLQEPHGFNDFKIQG